MQKPLSRRAAAALEAETDAIFGSTATRKRKVDEDKDGGDRVAKVHKPNTHISHGDAFPGWVTPDASFPSPISSFRSPAPLEFHYLQHSSFPTPSSDGGSAFKAPEPPSRESPAAGPSSAASRSIKDEPGGTTVSSFPYPYEVIPFYTKRYERRGSHSSAGSNQNISAFRECFSSSDSESGDEDGMSLSYI